MNCLHNKRKPQLHHIRQTKLQQEGTESSSCRLLMCGAGIARVLQANKVAFMKLVTTIASTTIATTTKAAATTNYHYYYYYYYYYHHHHHHYY